MVVETAAEPGKFNPEIAPVAETVTVIEAAAVPLGPVHSRLNVVVPVNTPVDWLSEVNLVPDQPPDAVQEVALVDDQMSVDVPSLVIDVGFAASDTVGTGGGGVVVVKFQLKLAASALPAASSAAVVMVAVYCVLPARLAEGVKVAVLPLTSTVPPTATPPEVVASLKLALVSVAFVIASVKVADTDVSNATPVAAFTGEVADTVGGVVSGTAAVVKLQVKAAASALPAASSAAVVMVAVYCVLPARLAEGVKVSVLPLTFTVPLTATSPEVVASLKLALVSVAFVIASEKVADTDVFNATLVAAFTGEVADTVGGVVSGVAPVVKFQVKLSGSALPAESVTPLVMVAVN